MSGLNGLRVLVVEDEALVSMLLEAMLEDLECVPLGPAETVADGLKLALQADGFDVALLDVNVAGERVFPVAEALEGSGKPFAFSSGYGDAGLPERWRSAPSLQKPYTFDDVRTVLTKLAAAR